MTAAVEAPRTARDAARFMGAYARRFHAGQFATPTAAEIGRLADAGGWHWWPGIAAASRRLTRTSIRTDFAGRRYVLPEGSQVLTHLTHVGDPPLPSLDRFDFVYAYLEDRHLTRELRAQGREVHAVRVSAASELIGCWARPGNGYRYPAEDRATLLRLPLTVPPATQNRILDEVTAIDSWHDDFPYYSDGSWGAVSLRGFNPADPTWGIKPAEMSKSWWAQHPEAAAYDRCDWTTLAERTPATVELVERITAGHGPLERVRLLRMAGRDGRGGRLERHTDITDRAAGTRDGQIVRFHLPIFTHPEITMSAWNLRGDHFAAHLPPWSLWYLDARKPHAVDNRAGVDRVHLVIDVGANGDVRAALAGHTGGIEHAA